MSQVKVKEKHWYSIFAPAALGNKEVGKALAVSPEDLMNRTVEVTLYELTGDVEQAHVHITLQVKRVQGGVGYTEFKGHHFSRDYLGGRIRRRYSKVGAIFDVHTKDGYALQLQAVAITATPASRAQRHDVRMSMIKVGQQEASNANFYDFVQEMVMGKLAQLMQKEAHKVFPIAFLDVAKSKVKSVGEQVATAQAVGTAQAAAQRCPHVLGARPRAPFSRGGGGSPRRGHLSGGRLSRRFSGRGRRFPFRGVSLPLEGRRPRFASLLRLLPLQVLLDRSSWGRVR
ncbi:MAG: 30S ribosomal protein S3ae [Candidatus Marsarchaeota archaeon]